MSEERWIRVAAEGLAVPSVAVEASGRGVRVAVVDTGVAFEHPHLGLPERAWSVAWEEGELVVRAAAEPHFLRGDRLGHGTCCAALLHLLAPDAELLSVRVTGDGPTTDVERLARGIQVAAEAGADIVCVALGTQSVARSGLDRAVAEASARGSVVVAADPRGSIQRQQALASGLRGAQPAGEAADGEGRSGPRASGRAPPNGLGAGSVSSGVLPAACPGALAACHRDGVDVVLEGGRLCAEGRARPVWGLPRNFWGASLSTARVAAALARVAEIDGERGEALRGGFQERWL